jgi:PhnB protein
MPITPDIVVQGAERAAAFYRDAFGATETSRIPRPDGRLMSVQMQIGDGVLHIADEFPEQGVRAPSSIGGTPVVLFWGDRHGQVEDPFGHRWSIAHHVRHVPHHEVVAAAARAFA